MAETVKRRLRGNPLIVAHSKPTQFSSERQPEAGQISKGMQKASLLRKVLDTTLQGDSEAMVKLRANLSALTGLSEAEVEKTTLEAAMHLTQVSKAVTQQDTYAYNSVLNREYGNPVTSIQGELTVKSINYNVNQEAGDLLNARRTD